MLSAALVAMVARREGRGAGDVHVKGLVVSAHLADDGRAALAVHRDPET